MNFVRANMDQIAKKITDDLWVLSVMEVRFTSSEILNRVVYLSLSDVFHLQRWYSEQVQLLCTWLTDRLDRSLHPYQCTCLAHIVKVRMHYSSRSTTRFVFSPFSFISTCFTYTSDVWNC